MPDGFVSALGPPREGEAGFLSCRAAILPAKVLIVPSVGDGLALEPCSEDEPELSGMALLDESM